MSGAAHPLLPSSRYASSEASDHAAQLQRALAIPGRPFARNQIGFLTRPEVEALFAAPDQSMWPGRRDQSIPPVAVPYGFHLARSDFPRMPRAVEKDETARPVPVGVLHPHTLVLQADTVAELVKQPPGGRVTPLSLTQLSEFLVNALIPYLLVSMEGL